MRGELLRNLFFCVLNAVFYIANTECNDVSDLPWKKETDIIKLDISCQYFRAILVREGGNGGAGEQTL